MVEELADFVLHIKQAELRYGHLEAAVEDAGIVDEVVDEVQKQQSIDVDLMCQVIVRVATRILVRVVVRVFAVIELGRLCVEQHGVDGGLKFVRQSVAQLELNIKC